MINELAKLDEFQKILRGYQISDAGKKILRDTKLVLMVGPSSAGRNTIINALTKTGEYHYIVSDTTRAPRENNGVMEKNGLEYWFRTEDDMLSDLRSGMFLEAAIIHNQQVSGISLRELERARDMQKIAVNEVEIIGMQNIIQAKPDMFALFVAPPSFDVWMDRMESRGKMSQQEKRRRLESAKVELTNALEKDYYTYIINDDFHHSVDKIHNLVLGGEHDPLQQKHGSDVIEKLIIETQNYLAHHR